MAETAAASDLSLGAWLAAVAGDATRSSGRVTIEDQVITVGELDADADAVASGLVALGLRPGDRVAVLMPAGVAALQTWFGVARAGLVEVPLNPTAGSLVLRYCLAASRVRAVVCSAELLDALREAAAGADDLRHVVVVGDSAGATGVVDFSRLLEHPVTELPFVPATSTAVILYTSGTTGPPKGVRLSHRANLNLARRTVDLMGYTAADRLYSVFPLYHSNARYCSVMAGLHAGASVLLHHRFSASGFWDTCRRERITAFNYQGSMMSLLHKQAPRPDDADHSVRIGFGAPCPAEILTDFEDRFGVALTEIYGSTEVSLVCEMPPSRRRVGTAGQESSIYTVAVVDEHDRPVQPGTPGEIVARPREGGWMFDGYDGDHEATLAACRNLWFHTGDRGVLDQDGYLTFLDRMKDTVRRRGENISTWEVERVLAEHPAVTEVAAYGVDSDLSEEEVMVAVVSAPGADPTPEELWRHCAGRLTAFAVPRYLRFVPRLPMTPSHRVEKYKLRAVGVTTDTYDREAR